MVVAYAVLPLTVLAALGILAMILRWATAPAKRVSRRSRDGYGLLSPIAWYDTVAEAERTAHHLRTRGIQASTSAAGSSFCVLVWAAQEPLARMMMPTV